MIGDADLEQALDAYLRRCERQGIDPDADQNVVAYLESLNAETLRRLRNMARELLIWQFLDDEVRAGRAEKIGDVYYRISQRPRFRPRRWTLN
jgi:hypothetical protein